jgi:hypothetical protein
MSQDMQETVTVREEPTEAELGRFRLKVFYVPIRELIKYLNIGQDPGRELAVISLPIGLTGVPDGAVVRSVHEEHNRMAFSVLVEHESFDPVPPGERIPEGDELLSLVFTSYRIVPVGE